MDQVFTPYHIGAVVLAYLLGAIPSAVWIGRAFFNIDVREHGSGNAGATNTFRVLGKKAGIPVLLIDIAKGWATVFFLARFSSFELFSDSYVYLQLTLGVAAVIGHIFPVYVGFRGGKGIATLLGVLLALHLQAAAVCLGIFLVAFVLSRIVSVGSMLAGISFPLVIAFVFKEQHPGLLIFATVVAILVLITHHKNIKRLLRKEENRISFKLKTKSK